MKTNKFKFLSISLLVSAIWIQACNSSIKQDQADSTLTSHSMTQDSTAHHSTDNMKNGSSVNQFMEQAAVAGMVEVEMGKIGQQNASLKSIKEFGAMIEKDHTQANSELGALAAAKGFQLPAAVPEMKQEHLNDLKRSSGKDFDSYYINMMVEDHIVDIALFEGAAKSADTAISSFAIKTLPVLKKHYKKAREISMQFDQNKNKK